jgi:hypothetical protein
MDETPIPAAYSQAVDPDGDRTGYTVGYGWQGKHFGVDAYVMQVDADDTTADGSPSDGVFNGTYSSSIVLPAVRSSIDSEPRPLGADERTPSDAGR